jgi:hypothetical protein
MSELTLTKTRLIGGVWEGVLTGVIGEDAPDLKVTHFGEEITGVTIDNENDQWFVRVAIPVTHVADGMQTFLIREAGSDAVLNSFALYAGDALAEDIRAEVDLLRAELDMLKQAFRRHCLEVAMADG